MSEPAVSRSASDVPRAGRGVGTDSTAGAPIRLVVAETGRQRSEFIKVPWRIYADDPRWVPPLILERRLHLSKQNPFFAHAKARFWIAYRGSETVGRISAQVDQLHLERYRDSTGFFGFLEAVDDPAVFAALLNAAETWLREHGMKRILGPFSLSINDEIGSLVSGFDTPPMFMMGHGRTYYDVRLKELGYDKAKDTVAYMFDALLERPAVMEAAVRRAKSRDIRVRPLRLSHLKEDLETIRDIYNDAWSENWNFIPFTSAELDSLGQSLKLFVPPEFVQIAEVKGQAAGMIVLVPNLNETIRDLNGRLLPVGWIRLLWRLKRSLPHTARVPLMGVRKEYHRSSLGVTLVFLLIDALRQPALERGIRDVELSWTLEDNLPMRHIKERIGARTYKQYRIYGKQLVGA
jgi:GNAT superfamily N-acetyltransferase